MSKKMQNKQAIALKYAQQQPYEYKKTPQPTNSPKVVAKGSGNVAHEIIEMAQQHGVLIHHDEELSHMLAQLDLGQEIPESMYIVIAELIAFSYVLQGKFPDNWNNIHKKVDFKE